MFETAIARLTASAGLPLRWVENPEWLALCERFIPSAKSPSRKVLMQRSKPSSRLHRNIVVAWREQSHTMDGRVATTIITLRS